MSRRFTNLSVMFVFALLISLFSSAAAFAADEKKIDVGNGSYVTVSNVIEESQIGSYPLYIAHTPVTLKFDGGKFARQFVVYTPNGTLQDGEFAWGENYEELAFDVRKYVIFGEEDNQETIVESLSEYQDYYEFPAGNYVTVKNPGYYYVGAAIDASEGTNFVVQVTDGATNENKPDTVSEQTKAEPAKSEPTNAEPTRAEPAKAEPTRAKVIVNGKEVSFEAYTIAGSNYFKLRDFAAAVNETGKQFEVSWDSEKNAISLESGKAYTPVGGELTVSENRVAAEGQPTNSKIYVDGTEVQLTAYNIGGNNYFKLRDLAKAFTIAVTWDGATNTIGIDTTLDYKE